MSADDTPTAAAAVLGVWARDVLDVEDTHPDDFERLFVALEAAGFRVIRPDPDLAARLRRHDHYCTDCDTVDMVTRRDALAAAALIDTDTGRTDG